MRHAYHRLCVLAAAGLAISTSAHAQPNNAQALEPPSHWYTQSDDGGVGLLQTPTARMESVGTLSVNINRTVPYTRYSFSVQPLPWLEGTFRYTALSNHRYGPSSLSGNQTYKDKAADIKVRLWREHRWLPALAVGAHDVGGTGLFSGEYIVANKRFGPLDASLGLGWGYLGARGDLRNPLGLVDDRFYHRPTVNGTAGKLNFNHFLRGPMAFFGGIQYQTPWKPLRLKVEYDGNDYQHEPFGNNLKQSSPFNFGVVYAATNHIDLTLGLERGNTALFGITLHDDIGHSSPAPKSLDPAPVPLPKKPVTTPPAEADWAAISKHLDDNAGFVVSQVARHGSELYVSGEQQRYFYPDEGVGRAARILNASVGPDIHWFTLVNHREGMPVVQTSVHRKTFVKRLNHDVSARELRRNVQRDPPDTTSPRTVLYRGALQRYEGGFGLGFSQSIGGPNAFVLYRVDAHYNASYHFTRHLWASGTALLDLLDNYDKFTYTAPSNLPRVRTNVREYLTTSRVNLPNLQLTWAHQLAPDWYGMAYGGLLESMFGGVGGQVLYRPFGTAFALGANVNWVKQRGFEQHFGFRHYQTVTGHVTAYIPTPIHDVLATVALGRYLARDWGGTLTLTRRFDNGVQMGIWATLTTADGKEFGEGSFDKGFFLTIPFSLLLPRSTRSAGTFVWDPLIRDGGAMLSRRYNLYNMTGDRDPYLFDANTGMLTQ